ncbi:CDP-alcohol phosphatidyltransferase family protein [Nocardioides zeae]|uniref:CDP-alcohol phosphatidyltransferase family protein n=1 Tax=Nocardioides imazamoxiresistens TaxID=3231893 RepID=A0ABU3PZQ7_9ACTN|nr:CDP-alcohol phosphatidyltransferase family protein [Nocardioides zeae]MDT9594351.1 CDP-alcohol phosphatidyltransferase family protein [Nocardioides zeae]
MRLWGISRPRVPDAFTLGNAVCGALAVFVLVQVGASSDALWGLSTLQLVSLLLVLGTVFDSLDGATARVFGGSSLGSQLDSLTDGLTFGLVPAMLLATLAIDTQQPPVVDGLTVGGQETTTEWWAYAVVVAGFLVYLAAALLRLADFSAVRCGDTDFVGLPSPLGAMLVVSAAYTTSDPVLLGALLAVVGYLMVSCLRFPHQGREMLPLAVGAWALVVCGALDVVDPPLLVGAIWVLVLVVLPVLAARSRGRGDDEPGGDGPDADTERPRRPRLRARGGVRDTEALLRD